MNLAELTISSRQLLSHFNYDEYPGCFEDFKDKLSGIIEEMDLTVSEPVHKDEMLQYVCAKLLMDLEDSRKDLSRKDKKKAFLDDKEVLALFLCPAALSLGGVAEALAKILTENWNKLYPKEKYYLGTYESIMKGFDANLLGLPLRKSKKKDR